MSISAQQVSITVLAGGLGRRMSGQNKGLIALQGKPMIQYVLDRLPQDNPIFISANNELERYRQFGYPVIKDVPLFEHDSALGPLHGIYSVLQQIQTDWLLTVPCDCPRIPEDYLHRMTSQSENNMAYVAYDGHRTHNGCVLLHRSLQNDILAQLQQHNLAMFQFLKLSNAKQVDFSEQAEGFININTPEDMQQVSQ